MSGGQLRAAAATVVIPTQADGQDSSTPTRAQDAPLRACAIAMQTDRRICIVTSDTIAIPPDVLQTASGEIVARTGIPLDHLLTCATHTHHAPCTIDILGCSRDVAFCQRQQQALIDAAVEACRRLDEPAADAELLFAQSQEASIGTNSRYLLKDGTTAWYAHKWEDVIRPTGPCDPDLPVLALRRPGGETIGTIFNHSVHNIGALTKGAWSPGFYGLAAQEIERRHGGVALFLPGAFGSTHHTGYFGANENVNAIPPAECVHRIVEAVEYGLKVAEPLDVEPLIALRRPFSYRLRRFDEAAEEAAVKYWSETYTPEKPQTHQQVFRQMREEMAPVQGEEREISLQVIRLGDVALVGLPGEIFARLGLEVRRRSPFRNTYIVGLANGTLGYVGDRASYALGGYQLWAGWHSLSEPGTGEAMVEQALEMLEDVYAAG